MFSISDAEFIERRLFESRGSENFGSVTKNVPDRPIMYCSILMISSPPPFIGIQISKTMWSRKILWPTPLRR